MPVTLDISAESLKLVSINGNRVEKWGTAPLSPSMVRDGLILQPQAVGAAIDALFQELKITKGGVIAAITGLSVTYRMLRLPRVKPALMIEAILRAAKKEIPLPLDEIYLSWQIIGTIKEEIEVFLFGAPRNLIDAALQTFSIAGVKPLAIDLKSLALARAANRPDALVINFEPNCFDIVVVTEGLPTILHTIIPRVEGATLEDNVKRLADELARTVDFYNITHAVNPIKSSVPVLLAGTLANDPKTTELIQNSVEYHVEAMTSTLKSPPDFPVVSYAGNIGLALKGMKQSSLSREDKTRFYDIDVDLLEGKRRLEIKHTPKRQLLLPVALMVAMVIMIIFSVAKGAAHTEKVRLQGEVDALTRELQMVRTRADQATTTEATIQSLSTETAALLQQEQQVVSNNVNDANILMMLNFNLPANMSFSDIEINLDKVTIQGQADSKEDIVSYAEALKQGYTQTFSKAPQPSSVGITKIDNLTSSTGSVNGLSFTIEITR
jgi:type IV pilus assembly protein PilM